MPGQGQRLTPCKGYGGACKSFLSGTGEEETGKGLPGLPFPGFPREASRVAQFLKLLGSHDSIRCSINRARARPLTSRRSEDIFPGDMVEAGNSTGPPGDPLLIQVESGTYGGSIRAEGAQQGPPNTQCPFPTRGKWEGNVPRAGCFAAESSLARGRCHPRGWWLQ